MSNYAESETDSALALKIRNLKSKEHKAKLNYPIFVLKY